MSTVLKVYCFADADKIVADSLVDAWTLIGDMHGSNIDDYDPSDMVRLSDDHVLKIRDEDTNIVTQKTCAEWAKSNGRGFLCTTEV